MIYKIIIGILLFTSFLLFFWWIRKDRLLGRWFRYTVNHMDAAARQRVHESRKQLTAIQHGHKKGLYRIEQRLQYCGLMSRYRWMTAEIWILSNLCISAAGYFTVLLLTDSLAAALLAIVMLQILRHLTESMMMSRNYRLVNDNLMKFLDFLGNYSITAGEITGIFRQISRYLDEPLKSVLDECYYEAQISGDVELALLAMSEKIEHPKFRELIRNIEISIRYSADFTLLVKNSRRAVREHMRTRQERKSLMTEAMINMMLLLGMAVVILMVVEQLIGSPIRDLLLRSWPGRICLTVILIIFALMFGQIRKLNR